MTKIEIKSFAGLVITLVLLSLAAGLCRFLQSPDVPIFGNPNDQFRIIIVLLTIIIHGFPIVALMIFFLLFVQILIHGRIK